MPFDKLRVEDVDFACKRVLIRADFDIPIKDGQISNPQKICSAIQTIKLALDGGAKYVVIASHMGNPNGSKDCSLSLRPVSEALQGALGTDVTFLPDCVGTEVEAALCKAKKGQVFLLENLRFHIEEQGEGCDKCGHHIEAKKEDVECFQQQLKKLADIYVNDALAASNYPDASIVACGFEIKAAGCALQKELEMLSKLVECPEKPAVLIIGGKLLTDKVMFILRMMELVDQIIVAGVPGTTFLKEGHGVCVGSSAIDEEGAKSVCSIMGRANELRVEIVLPEDYIAANEMSDNATICEPKVRDGIPEGFMVLDVGVRSRRRFKCFMEKAKTILFTGVPGMFELDKFACGSKCMMKSIADATARGAFTAAIGRSAIDIVQNMGMQEQVSYMSNGGESAFKFLEGDQLPGIEALSPKPNEC